MKPSERIHEIYRSLYEVKSTDINDVLLGLVAGIQAIKIYLDEQFEKEKK